MDCKQIDTLKADLTDFISSYRYAVAEMRNRTEILKTDFQDVHGYNPIEHVKYRVKTPESILKKAYRKSCDFNLHSIRDNIRDIAGMRITCSFLSDIYRICEVLQRQTDLEVVVIKDYISRPKPSGYKSLHLIMKVPVPIYEQIQMTWVEVQIRTIAMDFWASLEHKLNYKFNYAVPTHLQTELKAAAETVTMLDEKMENLNQEIRDLNDHVAPGASELFLWEKLLGN